MVSNGSIPMNKLQSTLLASMTLAATMVLPAFADGSSDALQNAVSLPIRTLSLASGLTVGTTIAIARKVPSNCSTTTASLVPENQKDFAPSWILAGAIGIPVGVVKGTLEGTQIGVKNALNSFLSDPFSTESLSLGDL
jgi:hypothetical protein